MWLTQLLVYGPLWWSLFLVIAFFAARRGGFIGVLVGQLLVAAIIVVLDVRWVRGAMRQPGWTGAPDMDAVFFLGTTIRVLLADTCLLPISLLGLYLRRRSSRALGETNA